MTPESGNWVISDGNVEVHFDKLLNNKELAIEIEVDGKRYWLPKSQIEFKEWSSFVEVPLWLAERKGLI